MTSFPGADEILSAWNDQAEALVRVWRARKIVVADATSRFHTLTEHQLEQRLETDRRELDRSTMMMVLASFDAVVRTDAVNRIQSKTRDAVRKPLRGLYRPNPDRVRFTDILDVWDGVAAVSATTKSMVRRLMKHRHWLAHGRYWTDKSAITLTPI